MKVKRLSILMALFLCFTMLSACGKEEEVVNGDRFNDIAGEYQLEDSYWHLSIWEDEDGQFLSIYDIEAGNPGIRGEITSLDQKNICIACDAELSEELPSKKWALEGAYLVLSYKKTEEGIILENGGAELEFITDHSLDEDDVWNYVLNTYSGTSPWGEEITITVDGYNEEQQTIDWTYKENVDSEHKIWASFNESELVDNVADFTIEGSNEDENYPLEYHIEGFLDFTGGDIILTFISGQKTELNEEGGSGFQHIDALEEDAKNVILKKVE